MTATFTRTEHDWLPRKLRGTEPLYWVCDKCGNIVETPNQMRLDNRIGCYGRR